MVALRKRSLPQVRAILESDPAATEDQLPDAHWQHPLCYAAQSQCEAGILGLLLDRGADINASDTMGRTALGLLCRTPAPAYVGLHPPVGSKPLMIPAACAARKARHDAAKDESQVETATYLLARGADASIPDVAGVLPSQHALACVKARLACLLRHYGDVQSCLAFSRVLGCEDRRVSAELVRKVSEFLVPPRVLARLGSILDGGAPSSSMGTREQQTRDPIRGPAAP